jgi:uncharacterized membrane protein YedE/YeeE
MQVERHGEQKHLRKIQGLVAGFAHGDEIGFRYAVVNMDVATPGFGHGHFAAVFLAGFRQVIVADAQAGPIAGISGIVAGTFAARGSELGWRIAFILGLVSGPLVVVAVTGTGLQVTVSASAAGLIVAGLLVGFGTRLGSGCTSGHGICGIARLSPRSLVATAVFVALGMAVVFIVRHLMGVPSWP